MAAGFMNCIKNRMEDMWLPFPDTAFKSVVEVAGFLRSAATVAKTIDGTDYTLYQLLRIMAARGALSGAAGVEMGLSEVLAVSGSFYIGALTGSLLICTAERLFKGPDNYSPKLSIYQIKTQFRHKIGLEMPADIEMEISSNPEMAGGDISPTWGSRWEGQFYASQGDELAYA
jgi:hypothetical protein